MSDSAVAPKSPPKPSLKERIEQLMVEYGKLALVVYFSIFAVVIVGFWVAIKLGIKTDSAAGTATTIGAAWVATKLTQPLRIAATLALTPVVMRAIRWFKTRGAAPSDKATPDQPTP